MGNPVCTSPDQSVAAVPLLVEAGPGSSHQDLAEAPWHVLWTRSHCEPLVAEQLSARGFHPFLPTLEIWSRRAGQRHRIHVPMFPGYLFLHDALDKHGDVEVRKARGLVSILGDAWDRRAIVPPDEIAAIRRVITARVPARPYPYLKDGQRVRIIRGPMADVEGILVRTKPNQGFLVLSVELLRRSIIVEIDCTLAIPV